MADETTVKELQKNRRLSLAHLRRGAILFGVTGIILLIVQRLIAVPLWIPFIILGVLSFTLVGDAFNYIYCGRRIRKLQPESQGSKPFSPN